MNELELPQPGRWSNSENWEAQCPFCQREFKFSWHVHKHAGHCRSTGCGKKIYGLSNYKRAYKGDLITTAYETAPKGPGKTVDLYGCCEAWDNEKSRNWLHLKGFSEITSRIIGLKYHIEDNELWVPISSTSPELPDRWLRRPLWSDDFKWLHERGCKSQLYGWNVDSFRSSKRNVLLCEGISDLAVTELYPYGIALLGSKPISEWFFWLQQNVNKVYVWFDPDEAGFVGNDICEKYLKYYRVPYEIIKTPLAPKKYDPKLNPKVRDYLNRLKEKIECGL